MTTEVNRVCDCATCKEQAILAAEFLCQLMDKGHCAISVAAVGSAMQTMIASLMFAAKAGKAGVDTSHPLAELLFVPEVHGVMKELDDVMLAFLEERSDGGTSKAAGDIVQDMLNGAVERANEKRVGDKRKADWDKKTSRKPTADYVEEHKIKGTDDVAGPRVYAFTGTLEELMEHLSDPRNAPKH
jgi:hypothetical protein